MNTKQLAALLGSLMACTAANAQVQACIEQFNDPLGDWTSGWLYLNSNIENYYVASGNCDDNERGNQPDGLWFSDEKYCGNLDAGHPVTMFINPELGDNATYFALDAYACTSGVTLYIYDKDGALYQSVAVAQACFSFANNYHFNLPNGISAFQFDGLGSQIEGNTAIDNVEISGPIDCSVTGIPGGQVLAEPYEPVPTLRVWALLLLAGLLGMIGFAAMRRRNASIR